MPLVLLLVHPAATAGISAAVEIRVERDGVLGTIRQLGTDRPVADRCIGRDTEHLAILGKNPFGTVGQTELRRLVVVGHGVEAEIELRVGRLPAYRRAVLARVLGVALGDAVGGVALAQAVELRPVAAGRREVVVVPLGLHVGLDIDAIAQAGRETDDGGRQEDFLELRARLRQTHDVHGVGLVDTAGQEQRLAPADHLVTDADAGALLADREFLAHPQIKNARLEFEVGARLVGQGGGIAVRAGRRADVAGRLRRREVAQPADPAHELPVVGHLEQQLVRALEVSRESIALLVVDVALVANAGNRGAALGCTAAAGTAHNQTAGRALGADADPGRDRRVETAGNALGFEGEGRRAADVAEQCRDDGFLEKSVHGKSPVLRCRPDQRSLIARRLSAV